MSTIYRLSKNRTSLQLNANVLSIQLPQLERQNKAELCFAFLFVCFERRGWRKNEQGGAEGEKKQSHFKIRTLNILFTFRKS